MGTTMNQQAFEKIIAENLEWLDKQPHSLERDHIKQIVQQSLRVNYPDRPKLTRGEFRDRINVYAQEVASHGRGEMDTAAVGKMNDLLDYHDSLCVSPIAGVRQNEIDHDERTLHDQAVIAFLSALMTDVELGDANNTAIRDDTDRLMLVAVTMADKMILRRRERLKKK